MKPAFSTPVALAIALFTATFVARAAAPELRYQFKAGSNHVYSLKLEASEPKFIAALEGTVTYTVKSANADGMTLVARGSLRPARQGKDGGSTPRPPMGPGWGGMLRVGGFRFGAPSMGGPFGPPPDEVEINAKGQVLRETGDTTLGQQLRQTGDTTLPPAFGVLSRLIVEPLPPAGKTTFEIEGNCVLILEEKAFLTPMTYTVKEVKLPAKEKTVYTVAKAAGDTVAVKKTYELKTLATVGGVPRFEMKGAGTNTFDAKAGLFRTLEFSGSIVETSENVTIRTPLTLVCKLLEGEAIAPAPKAPALPPKSGSVSLIPVMTGYTAPSGVASASSEAVSSGVYNAWRAFDGQGGHTVYNSFAFELEPGTSHVKSVGWLKYEFPATKVVNQYRIIACVDYGPSFASPPKNWTFEGWDGVSWVVLDTRTNAPDIGAGGTGTYNLTNSVAFIAYRLNVTVAQTSGFQIAQLQMWSLGQLLCPPSVSLIPVLTNYTVPSGVASASSEWTQAPYGTLRAWLAFDGHGVNNPRPPHEPGNNQTLGYGWRSAVGASAPQWLQYQFAAAQVARSYLIIPISLSLIERCPKDWTLQGGNDGATWTVLDTRKSVTDWVAGEAKSFAFTNSTAYLYYRLSMTANNGGEVFELSQWQLLCPSVSLIPVMTGYTVPSGVASASSEWPVPYRAWWAFDGKGLTHGEAESWSSLNDTIPQWLQYQFVSPVKALSYRLTPQNNWGRGYLNRAPTAWQLQGSNDGAAWTTLDSQTGITNWADYTVKTFTFANSTAYLYFRLNMTANGGGDVFQLSQWELLLCPLTRRVEVGFHQGHGL